MSRKLTQFRITVTGTRNQDGLVRFTATTTPTCPAIEEQLTPHLHRLFELGEADQGSYIFEVDGSGPATKLENLTLHSAEDALEVKALLETLAEGGLKALTGINEVLDSFGGDPRFNFGEVDRMAATYLNNEERRMVDPEAPAFDFSSLDVKFASSCRNCGRFHQGSSQDLQRVEANLSRWLGGIGVTILNFFGGILGRGEKKEDKGNVVYVDTRFGAVFPDYVKAQLLGSLGEKGILQLAIEATVVEMVQQRAAQIVQQHSELTTWATELDGTDIVASQVTARDEFVARQRLEFQQFQEAQASELERFKGGQERNGERFETRQARQVEERFVNGERVTTELTGNVKEAGKLADLMAHLASSGLTAQCPDGFDDVVVFEVKPVAPRPVVEPVGDLSVGADSDETRPVEAPAAQA